MSNKLFIQIVALMVIFMVLAVVTKTVYKKTCPKSRSAGCAMKKAM